MTRMLQKVRHLSLQIDTGEYSHSVLDYRGTVEPSVLIDYAKKDFGPDLQAVTR